MTDADSARRLFLALVPDAESKARISELAAELSEKTSDPARWVHADDYHLTLRFFGDVSASVVSALKRALLPVTLSMENTEWSRIVCVGGFPKPRSRILACTLENNHHQVELADIARDATHALVSGDDRHSFKPHVTVARLRHAQEISIAIDHTPLRFDRLSLFSSRQATVGPRYQELWSHGFDDR